MDLIRAKSELASLDDVQKALNADAPGVSTNVSRYVNGNKLGYYVLINTWCLMVRDYSEYGWFHLLSAITNRGLLPVIAEAQTASEELINGLPVTSLLFKTMVNDIMKPKTGWGVPNNGNLHGSNPMTTVLGVLRYPKRFSPIGADKIQAQSISQFLMIENRSKQWQHRSYNQYWMSWVKGAMDNLLNWDSLCDELVTCIEDHQDLTFTGGVGYDSKASLGSKLLAISETHPEYFMGIFGFSPAGMPVRGDEGWYPEGWDPQDYNYPEAIRPVRVAAVPKSFKAARIIAMEDTYRQAKARSMASIIDRYLPANIRLHDQTQNQELARLGSLDGDVATLDLSSASDTITKTMFWEVFPLRFSSLVYPYLGTHTEIDGKRRVMQQMSTSGNSLTFILESLIFLAIDVAAAEIAQRFGLEPQARDYTLPVPSVYGDDQIVDTAYYEVTVQLLQALGFIVNEAKSYAAESVFRESCGADWYLGIDVASTYFPRFPIRGSISSKKVEVNTRDYYWDSYREVAVNSLVSLISLQHRLFEVSYAASFFIRSLVCEAQPRMTVSQPFSEASDLWDYDVHCQKRWAPGARACDHIKLVAGDPECEATYGRLFRFLPHTRYTEPTITQIEKELYDAYKYQQFLRHGPQYLDDNLRMLGISERPRTYREVFGRPETFWDFAEATEL